METKKILVVIDVQNDFITGSLRNEEAIKKVPNVLDCQINFMTQKMTIEISDEEFDSTLKKAIKAAKKIEPDFEVCR